MAVRIIRPENTDFWLEMRKGGIGSSEIASVLGLNPWTSPYQLWLRKTGQTPPQDENFAMKAGHYLEDAVANFYQDETGRKIIKRSAIDWIAIDSEKPFLRVSPDRTYWLEGKHSNNNKGIVELKTTQMAVDADDLPKHWFCQLQYQLGVMGLTEGSLAWLTAGRKFGYVDVKFNQKLYDYMVEKATEFWKVNVQQKIEPKVTTVDDVLIKHAMHTEGKFVEASNDLINAYMRIKEAKKEAADTLDSVKELEEQIKLAIGDAEGMTWQGDVIATWKAPKPRMEIDTKAMIAENPELAKKYEVERSGSRRFLLK